MPACPACQQVNAADAALCSACGSPLVLRCPSCHAINARTRDACHHCEAPLRELGGAESGQLLTLRLDDLPELPDPIVARPALAPLPLEFPPIVDDRLALPPVPPPVLTRAERKAAQRASVRRAQQRHQRRALVDPGVRPDVLLLEPNDEIRVQLAEILQMFGFHPRQVATVAQADQLALETAFVAAFIGLTAQDSLASGLCTRLRAAPRPSMRPLAVVAMVDQGRHTDRVRMELAGADEVLFRPLDRGDVARALENCGVPLPHDPRSLNRP